MVTTGSFSFPEYHAWPFFYTIQKNADTRDRQMKMWSDLIVSYSKSKAVYSISLGELHNSALCVNQKINRRLAHDDLQQVCDWMQSNGFGEYTSPAKEKIFVFWEPIQKIADAIHKWADSTGRIGSVETILDLCDDEANTGEIFY